MKRLMILAAFLCAAASAQENRITVSYTRFTLPNGLEVILHEDHTTPTICVNTWYHVGSNREITGHTGLAHLFEHLMFMGSGHVPLGKFDEWLEAAGGENNASTTADRTNYYEDAPSNALELPLFLESDRMGYLLQTMTPEKVDAQRDVVKNERRESYENQPYGMAELIIPENLFPPDHPYHWSTIGSMEDLSAASYDDVARFFKTYYVPNNASLVIAGDIDPVATRAAVTKWFADVPAGARVPPLAAPGAYLAREKRVILEDRVQLPRLYISWLSPARFAPGDAEMDMVASILAGGKNSRLYKRLVYDLQIAQDVSAYQDSRTLGSDFQLIVTARFGHPLPEIEAIVQEEINRLKTEPPSLRELQRGVNQYESAYLARLESVGGKADLLNAYFMYTGNPDYFQEDLARYKALDPMAITAAARTYLKDDGRLVLSVVPTGKRELAAPGGKEGQ